MQFSLKAILTFLNALIIAAAVDGADLETIRLVTDGSATPPGDRIDVEFYFRDSEDEIQLSVRGFSVSGDGEIVTPLNNGKNLVVSACRRQLSAQGKVSLVVPYSKLLLPKGDYQIAYEVIATSAGKVQFTCPTRLTKLRIIDGARRKIEVTESMIRRSDEKRRQRVIIAGETGRGEPAQPKSEQADIVTPVETEVLIRKVYDTNIAGAFLRSSNPEAASDNESENQKPVVSDAESLKDQPWQTLKEINSENDRIVWFSTNRQIAKTEKGSRASTGFGSAIANSNSYGSCVVNVPIQNHKKGNLETPSWWKQRDPKKHFAIEGLKSFSRNEFSKQVGREDLLLFVHGFNNSFADSIYRTTQLQYDLAFAGQAIAFSWPSAGKLDSYQIDQQNADASVEALVETITTLADSLNSQPVDNDEEKPRLHILAHSMGNRILVQALYKINVKYAGQKGGCPIGQIILAAPDVGAIMFNNFSPHALDLADQVTYYYCETDAALNVSRDLNKYEPVGLFPYFEEGLCTISANGEGTSFIAHNYYASSRKVLNDIELIIKEGKPPSQRMPPLATEFEVYGHRSWAFSKRRKRSQEKK